MRVAGALATVLALGAVVPLEFSATLGELGRRAARCSERV
jgi:hypothetical protein